MFKTILFPLNRSQETRQAVDVAISLVQKYQATLYVLSVTEPDGDRQSSEALITEMQDHFAAVSISIKTKIAEGKAAFVICDYADEINADLIVMGSRGMSLAEEHPDDSVSQKVINLSPCAVLVVP